MSFQLFTQPQPRPVDLHLHISLWNVHCRTDLLVRESLEVRERKEHSVFFRKAVERVLDDHGAARAHKRFGSDIVLHVIHGYCLCCMFFLAEKVVCHITRDPAQPWPEVPAAFYFFDIQKCLDKRILGQVHCRIPVTHHPVRNREYELFVGGDKFGHRRFITPLRAPDQIRDTT